MKKRIFTNTITGRWILSTILVIALILTFASVSISFYLKTYYHDTCKLKIESISQSVGIANYFSGFLTDDAELFAAGAKQYVEDFAYSNLAEVWVLDGTGKVIVTSTGFSPEDTENISDYYSALDSDSGRGAWTGKMSTGEDVYALTVLLPKTDGKSNGAVRFITSLADVNTQWLRITAAVFILSSVSLLMVITSGFFFIRSIVRPVKKLNGITQKIAAGDFTVRADMKPKNDEIGELCHSINHMTEELSKTDQLKNEFISTVSHELRTPLTAIKGWTETLQTFQSEDRKILADGLSVISAEADRLYAMVEDLLDFSKIESGRLQLHFAPMDVFAELEESVLVLKARAEREGIRIRYTDTDDTAMICGDADRIKQVFFNLLDNAIKFTQSGGVIEVSAHENEDGCRVVFSDTGKGISESDLPRVKEKFYKSDSSVKGSGIGLAVCDEIVRMHGGALTIHSVLGDGTTAEVFLPKQRK